MDDVATKRARLDEIEVQMAKLNEEFETLSQEVDAAEKLAADAEPTFAFVLHDVSVRWRKVEIPRRCPECHSPTDSETGGVSVSGFGHVSADGVLKDGARGFWDGFDPTKQKSSGDQLEIVGTVQCFQCGMILADGEFDETWLEHERNEDDEATA